MICNYLYYLDCNSKGGEQTSVGCWDTIRGSNNYYLALEREGTIIVSQTQSEGAREMVSGITRQLQYVMLYGSSHYLLHPSATERARRDIRRQEQPHHRAARYVIIACCERVSLNVIRSIFQSTFARQPVLLVGGLECSVIRQSSACKRVRADRLYGSQIESTHKTVLRHVFNAVSY
jgi:hypothetical protein